MSLLCLSIFLLVALAGAAVDDSNAVVNLQRERLSPAYRHRLWKAGNLFAQFCQSHHHHHLQHVLMDANRANTALIEFIQHTYEIRRPLWLATHAVLAVQTVNRELKGHLRPAWDSIQSWRLTRPVQSRTPLPEFVMKALCYFGVMQAMYYDTNRALVWFPFSVNLRFAFYALFRPREMFMLVRCCLKLPFRSLLGGGRVAVATILDPKNRAFMGRLQVRMVRDFAAIAWMEWYVEGMSPSAPLWPFSDHIFRVCLQTSLEHFGLEKLGITVASLRAGGATWLLEQGTPLSNIRFAGSWASERAMSCYLQEAESASVLLSMLPSQQLRLEKTLARLRALELPPNKPLSAYLYHGSAEGL